MAHPQWMQGTFMASCVQTESHYRPLRFQTRITIQIVEADLQHIILRAPHPVRPCRGQRCEANHTMPYFISPASTKDRLFFVRASEQGLLGDISKNGGTCDNERCEYTVETLTSLENPTTEPHAIQSRWVLEKQRNTLRFLYLSVYEYKGNGPIQQSIDCVLRRS